MPSLTASWNSARAGGALSFIADARILRHPHAAKSGRSFGKSRYSPTRDLKSSVSPPGSTYHITNEGKRANMVKPITGVRLYQHCDSLHTAGYGGRGPDTTGQGGAPQVRDEEECLGTASGYFWWYGK
ncbi:hypothetical protein D0865_00802 [Hortaea werneckii]|uniref:Uncharacterized protein n=1 Tax=Hortaea werneckii TaxID=91943 RepID=A0A3M7DC24_HORWE|nr:hypothetical protein D0865_00802 [Hortaea werneckii]